MIKKFILNYVMAAYATTTHRYLRNRIVSKITLGDLTLNIGSKSLKDNALFPQKKIISIDLNPKENGMICCDALNLCFKRNCFDSIVCFECIEYIDDLEIVLNEVSRTLKPNGLFFCTSPFQSGYHFDNVRYTPHYLKTIACSIFDNIEIFSYGNEFSLIADFIYYRSRKSGIFLKLFITPLILFLRWIGSTPLMSTSSGHFFSGVFLVGKK